MQAKQAPDRSTQTNRTREYFVENMQVGNVVAFTVDSPTGPKMLSGRVIQIATDKVTIRTKNASIFYPKKDQIVWVRTGTKWPLGIYNALKFNE